MNNSLVTDLTTKPKLARTLLDTSGRGCSDEAPWATFENVQENNNRALGCFIVSSKHFQGDIAALPIPDQAHHSTLAVHFRVVDSTADVPEAEEKPEFMVVCAGNYLGGLVKSLAPQGSEKKAIVHRADGIEEGTPEVTDMMSTGRKFWVEIVKDEG